MTSGPELDRRSGDGGHPIVTRGGSGVRLNIIACAPVTGGVLIGQRIVGVPEKEHTQDRGQKENNFEVFPACHP